jgi:hypothetical protein
MLITYMLQYLDKITLGYVAVLGIQKDTVPLFSSKSSIELTMNSIW